jgi:hypothetical protein
MRIIPRHDAVAVFPGRGQGPWHSLATSAALGNDVKRTGPLLAIAYRACGLEVGQAGAARHLLVQRVVT